MIFTVDNEYKKFIWEVLNWSYIMAVKRLLNLRRSESKDTIKISILDFTAHSFRSGNPLGDPVRWRRLSE